MSESERVCKNCKYYGANNLVSQAYKVKYMCHNEKLKSFAADPYRNDFKNVEYFVDAEFGCNQFEQYKKELTPRFELDKKVAQILGYRVEIDYSIQCTSLPPKYEAKVWKPDGTFTIEYVYLISPEKQAFDKAVPKFSTAQTAWLEVQEFLVNNGYCVEIEKVSDKPRYNVSIGVSNSIDSEGFGDTIAEAMCKALIAWSGG